ncbi:MAG TPA: RidA family protein [Acetobacteraceae bacterium]|jgi:enamine deaminase RidA (YjgF/YER057c/UK114 family)|nr:RidA family protein [Acetobacteraceae bacterium]
MTGRRILQPAGWPRPSGYSNGIAADGPTIVLAGQIGWDPISGCLAEGLAAQVEQALRNIVALLAEAGAESTDVVRLTWFVTDMEQYRRDAKAIGQSYRRVMGKHYPTMSVIGVSCLVVREALVEIEATAVADDG